MTTSNPLRLGLVPSQVHSGPGRTVTWTPESARLAARASVETALVSARMSTLGPSPAADWLKLRLGPALKNMRGFVLRAAMEAGASLARGCGPLVATTGWAFIAAVGSVAWSLVHAS